MPRPLKRANTICEKVLEDARAKKSAKLTVEVLEDSSNLKAAQREDGASVFRYGVALGKAWGAVAMKTRHAPRGVWKRRVSSPTLRPESGNDTAARGDHRIGRPGPAVGDASRQKREGLLLDKVTSMLIQFKRCAKRYLGTLLLGVAACLPAHSQAQLWTPTRNVELIVPGTGAGGQDRAARTIQRVMQQGLVPTTVSIINRPGGGSNLAYVYLNQFTGNGHYLASATATLLTNYILGTSPLNYTHFTPVSVLYGEYIGFAVTASGVLKSGKDVIERVKAAPDSVTFAFGTSAGNANHIAIALVMKAAGINPTRIKTVVFKGSGEAVTALMGGHVDVVATPLSTLSPFIGTGKIRIAAIAAPQRIGGRFADMPTWREQGNDTVMPSFRMFIAAKGLDARQLRYWDGVFAKLATSPEWRKDLADNESQSLNMNSTDTLKYLDAQEQSYRRILTDLGLARK